MFLWPFEAKLEVVSLVLMFCLSHVTHLDIWTWPGDWPQECTGILGTLGSLFYNNKVQLLKL
jgi:hypothetical protein